MKATIASLIGSLTQLGVTVIAGIVAFVIVYTQNKNTPIIELITFKTISWFLIAVGIILIALATLKFFKSYFAEKLHSCIAILWSYNLAELFKLVLLSSIRYFVFSIQYYLILLAFNIHIDMLDSFLLIALTFFVTSSIPTFYLTEIAIRGAASVYFFSTATNDSAAIVASSLLLWVINLAIPALVGSVFVWNFNLAEKWKILSQ